MGNFYRIYPTQYYRPIAPGDSLQVTILFRGSLIKEIEAPMGMYFVPCDADGKELTPLAMDSVRVAPLDPALTACVAAQTIIPSPMGR